MNRIGGWLAGLWPRRIAAVIVVFSAAWSLRAPDFLSLLVIAALQALAAVGLWKRWRWAWWATLLLQFASLVIGLVFAPRALATSAWWLQQWPHALVILLLLLPESRRSRAALREPGFEPGDTTPVTIKPR